MGKILAFRPDGTPNETNSRPYERLQQALGPGPVPSTCRESVPYPLGKGITYRKTSVLEGQSLTTSLKSPSVVILAQTQ